MSPTWGIARLAFALAIVTAVGCDRAATAPVVVESTRINEIVLEDRASGTLIYSHLDHWHGFPVVPANGTLTLRKYFVPNSPHPDDHDPASRSSWFTLETLPTDIGTRIVTTDTMVLRGLGTRVDLRLEGRRPGSTPLSIVVRRNSTTLYEAPPLNAVVR